MRFNEYQRIIDRYAASINRKQYSIIDTNIVTNKINNISSFLLTYKDNKYKPAVNKLVKDGYINIALIQLLNNNKFTIPIELSQMKKACYRISTEYLVDKKSLDGYLSDKMHNFTKWLINSNSYNAIINDFTSSAILWYKLNDIIFEQVEISKELKKYTDFINQGSLNE
jgi:hypothetical protein